jgi:hypothetical protein
LLEPLVPPAAADLAALRASADEIEAAHQEIAAARAGVDERAAALARLTARDDADTDTVERLSAERESAAATIDAGRRRVDAALARADAAAGDAPDHDAALILETARRRAGLVFALAGESEEAALAAARKGRAFAQAESGDATTWIAAAEASLAAGKLADARKDLDRASRLLRAAGKDTRALAYAYGELHDRLAARSRDPAERRRLLEEARRNFDVFAARPGGGARAAAARARSAEIAEELRQ